VRFVVRRLLPALVILVALVAAGCGSGTNTVASDQAATVDGTAIPVKELTALVEVGSSQQQSRPANDTTRQALEGLIQSQIVLGGAKGEGVTVADADVDARLSQLREQVEAQGGAFEELLRQRNLTVPILRNQLRVQLAAERVAAKLVPGPSDAALTETLGKRKAEFMQLHIRHVLVKDEATADKVRQLLEGKGDWAGVARQYSTDPGSKDKGGDLGFQSKGQTVAEFDNKSFELAGKGDCKGKTEGPCASPISEPVKTQFGWHVIQVTGVQLPKLDDQLRGQLDPGLQQRRQTAVQDWFSKRLKAASVTVNPRFGRWDAAAGKVVDRETAPQSTAPPTRQPSEGPATTTSRP
jgi:foldase protein PrsA